MCTVDPDVTTNRLSFSLWLSALRYKRIPGFLALLICHNAILPVYATDSFQTGISLQPNVSPSAGVVIRVRPEEGVFGSKKSRFSKLPPMNPPSLNKSSVTAQEVKGEAPSTATPSSPSKQEGTSSSHGSLSQTKKGSRKHGLLKRPNASPKATEAETESEVINNILGAPVVTTPKVAPEKETTPNPGPTDPTKTASPSPANANAPAASTETSSFPEPSNFDYGIYTYNCHLLDDYVQRVRNGLQLAQELGFSRPKKQIEDLLKVTAEQRRIFTDKYPSPKQDESEKGLQAFDIARQSVLEALALSTISPRVEGRAIWLDRASIVQATNPEGLKALLARLHQAGINIIYFETVNAGFPIYPSKITTINPLIHNWDPLAVAVEEGHRMGMEVHAWVWCFAVGNRRHNELIGQPETYPGPVLSEPGLITEALRNRHGGLAVDSRQHEFWLSPASPKAKAFLINLYSEIVTNYAVDGIHLDYIRYPFQTSSTRMGYETPGRLAYHTTTGKSVDDTGTDSMRLWAAWKTVQVSNFVRDVSSTLRPLRPGLKISAAVFPMRRAARLAAIQQDWETWVEQGWVDSLSPMSYTSDPQRLKALYESVVASPQVHGIVYPGIALSHLDNGQLMLQLEALRDDGSLGSTLFAATHLSADKANSLGSGPYRQNKALVPHRDLLQSVSTSFNEYQDTITRLSSNTSSDKVPTLELSDESLHALKRSIEAFSVSLSKLQLFIQASMSGPQHVTLEERIGEAVYNLSALQQTQAIAMESEHHIHPQRAQYLDKALQQLKNLMVIYSDHLLSASPAVETAQQSQISPVTVNSAFRVLANRGTPQAQKQAASMPSSSTGMTSPSNVQLINKPVALPAASAGGAATTPH